MQDDATLLRQYAEARSDAAFAELVRRHLDLVYSAALRQVGGDTHLAKDVAQGVFADLARKAASAANCPVLAGWLHTSTHYAAAKAVRSEQRRRSREQAAHLMHELLNESAHDAAWSRMRPVLDDAMRSLDGRDRDALLLRFFEGAAFARIGARLNLTENAARMRVERALEKLREQLTRRGISSTTGALATVLASQTVAAAPAALATSVTSAALASAAGGGAVVSLLQFMAITKTQVAVVGAVLIAGGSAVVSQQQTAHELRGEIATLNVHGSEIAALRETNHALARASAEVDALQASASAAELDRLRTEIRALQDRAKAATIARSSATTGKSSALSAEEIAFRNTLDRVPEPKERTAPVFPFEMRQAGISGEVIVSLLVDSDGNVQNASAAKSTHPEFETPALEAVKKWKFTPGKKSGRTVITRMQIPIVFQLDPDEENWF